MWGTKKDASTTVVLHTVRQLTKLDSNKRLSVKRKFYEGEPGRRDRWWFLLRGPESVLDELENLWNCVSLQGLETCTKPSNDSRVGADSNANERVSVHANSSNVESKAEAQNDVSNSPAPVNASNPGLSGPETPSSRSVDMQTHHVDVNNANFNQSVSDDSHHNPMPEPVSDNVFLDK